VKEYFHKKGYFKDLKILQNKNAKLGKVYELLEQAQIRLEPTAVRSGMLKF